MFGVAPCGGAMYARFFTVRDCVFLFNGGQRGGAVSEGTYRNCYFEGNTGKLYFSIFPLLSWSVAAWKLFAVVLSCDRSWQWRKA